MNQEFSESRKPLASIPLQTFIYFDQLYYYLYFIISIGVFVYKGFGLFYPPNTIGVEVFLLIIFAIGQGVRLYVGSSGNRTESSS